MTSHRHSYSTSVFTVFLILALNLALCTGCPGIKCPQTDTPGVSRAVVHLQDGSSITGRICGPEQMRFYSLDVPAMRRLRVDVTAFEGTLGAIYLKQGECPTQHCADAYHVRPLSHNRTVSLCSTQAGGTWHIGVLSSFDYSHCVEYSVTAVTLDLRDFGDCEAGNQALQEGSIPYGALVLLSLTIAIFLVTSAMGLCIFFRHRAGLPAFPWQDPPDPRMQVLQERHRRKSQSLIQDMLNYTGQELNGAAASGSEDELAELVMLDDDVDSGLDDDIIK